MSEKKKFSKLSRPERISFLLENGYLTSDEAKFLESGAPLAPELAEHFIENVIGYFQIPLGVAPHFRIDGQDYMIPMAVEETSIIAAASATAKWVKTCGEIRTEQLGQLVIGQIQLARVLDPESVKHKILEQKKLLLEKANQVAEGLVRRGGGATDIQVRILSRGVEETSQMVVVHVLADPKDAMGANIMNQMCEALKAPIQEITGERVTMCILSNLVDTKLTRAQVTISNIDPALGEGIAEASLFAQLDPYRAATNNKGVLNGMDSVILATGNDWRAVEAGVHAYAARDGQYRSITKWEMKGSDLVGTIEAPVVVGTVGGVTRIHPTARMCLNMLQVKNAEMLSRVIAAVGLVQNLGALKALSTVGIVEGHMKLHATNLALAAGAEPSEISGVKTRLEQILKAQKRVTLSQAIEALALFRKERGTEHVQSLSSQ